MSIETLIRAAELLREYSYLEPPERVAERQAIAAELEAMAEQEPVAYMFPSDLERFRSNETFAQAYSVAVGNPDESSTPLYATPQPRIPEGWQLVPKEPTDGMVSQGYATNRFCQRNFGVYGADPKTLYRAMLAAAPSRNRRVQK